MDKPQVTIPDIADMFLLGWISVLIICAMVVTWLLFRLN